MTISAKKHAPSVRFADTSPRGAWGGKEERHWSGALPAVKFELRRTEGRLS
jgi:hypothetical protein